MKILIFAGGSGTRLWPLSRRNLPKQFRKMFNGKSTLQLAVERIEKTFGTNNIFISTNEKYISILKDQVPQIQNSNIVGEPVRRDLAPAIGYNFIRLKKMGYSGPVAILWADHLMENVANFLDVLKKGELLVSETPKRLVFIGEKPRYAENNLGWIHLGKELKEGSYEYKEWYYKPPLDKCKEMFASGEWVWNPGYFIVDLDNILSLYKEFVPQMYAGLEEIGKVVGTVKENEVLQKIYPELEAIDFDKAILEKVPSQQAVVLKTNMGWSDPGTLYALKEALVGNEGKNLSKGNTYESQTEDSVVINEDAEKLLVTLGLKNMLVINTKDVLLVVHKDDVINISGLVKELESQENYEKYI
jgi:mannose-1-phosphate guanylyltransferase